MALFTLTKLTFREASRRKILLAAVLLGVVFLVVFGIGFSVILNDYKAHTYRASASVLEQGENLILMAGLYAVNFLTVMMTVLTSVDTISGEINTGTIHTLVSKPVPRWQIILGKWLGFVILLTLYLIMMAGGVFLTSYLVSGYMPPNPVAGMVLLWLNAILLLSVSFWGGTRLSTLANGVMVFGLFGVAFVGGWVEQIGAFFQNQTAINIGIISSLILPTDALWKRAAFEMQTSISNALGLTPFSSSSVPSPIMVVYAVLYLVVALALGVRAFQRRDL
ncbi:MAG: ABC transporter permease [Chloroflexi bacterium]|nr:ABC transporter permease [Chloroflexota bacterium]